MSADLSIAFDMKDKPTNEAWEKAAQELGYKFKITTDGDITKSSGWYPIEFNGETAGFEAYTSSADELAEFEEDDDDDEDDEELNHGKDTMLMFACGRGASWSSGVVAAAAWAILTGGVIDDPQSGEEIPAADAADWAKDAIYEE
jgi:hypothetical protein